MTDTIKSFQSRWSLVKDSCLSTLRTGLKSQVVDIEEVNYTFSRKVDEWFNGSLAPAIWFDDLKSADPEKAGKFRQAVESMRIEKIPYDPPATWWTILVGAMVALSVFCALWFLPLPGAMAEWSVWILAILSVGLGILFYYIFDTVVSRNVAAYDEGYMENYVRLFDEMGMQLTCILES